MRREDDDRYRKGVRNGGPAFDSSRFSTDYLDQTSLSDFRSNEPKFELDHLATFAAGTRNGVIHAEDGLRKLRQMENTTGIWSMRCVLIVERGNLVILDNSTAEELERFPIQQVQDPTAIFKNDRREIYNNLILFTIVDDAKRRGSSADMHIFQSCKSPAQEIVDEVLAAKSGQQRIYPPGGGSRIPPPPMGPAPEPPYDLQAMSFGGQQRSFITRVGDLREKEDYTGGSTEILERDVVSTLGVEVKIMITIMLAMMSMVSTLVASGTS
ncbi:epidermal growth factor receptor kinase substrate 8 [Elysia marginata]|uniref:Epidermal growth factor receptor kinase substrate 8 n=1 Tax=Elysia marginata TaxID=1093978 RepID=A0AAV4FRX4_9GAST|nr:epidermal growth factor receptor kinase substrate 8 [Elysia marginata]